jgi:hypothetical protein
MVQGEGAGADHQALRVAHRRGHRPDGGDVELQGVGPRRVGPPGRHLQLRLRRRRGRLLLRQPHHLRGKRASAQKRPRSELACFAPVAVR